MRRLLDRLTGSALALSDSIPQVWAHAKLIVATNYRLRLLDVTWR